MMKLRTVQSMSQAKKHGHSSQENIAIKAIPNKNDNQNKVLNSVTRHKKNLLLSLVIVFGSILSPCYLAALPSDNNEKIVIKSQKFEIDYKQGYAVYYGDVHLKQGTRDLQSDKLYIYFENVNHTASNIKTIKAVANDGQRRAVYSEDLEKSLDHKGNRGILSASAKVIELIPSKNLLSLKEDAVIEQNGRRLTSELLHYNFKTEVAYTPKLENKRTKVILG